MCIKNTLKDLLHFLVQELKKQNFFEKKNVLFLYII